MKKQLFLLIMGIVLIFITTNFIFSLKEYNFTTNLNLILTQALAEGEAGEDEYYQCFDCTIPGGPQLWRIVCPTPYGYPGCLAMPCGYNYICD